jgi:hypothetical protein
MRLRMERMVLTDCLRCPHVLGGGLRSLTSTGRCQRCALVKRADLIRLLLFRDGEEA